MCHFPDKHLRFLVLAALAVGVVGCAVQQPPETTEVVEQALPQSTEVPADWQATVGDTGEVDDAWIASFDDPLLTALVDEALQNNRNLQAAAAQVERSTALARIAGSQLKPTVVFAGDVAQLGGSDLIAGMTDWSGGVAMSWEADVWGRVRAGTQAAEEAFAASQFDYAYARLSLAATVAKAWFLATETALMVRLSEESVDLFNELRDLVRTKKEVGQISMQEVHLAEADVASAEEALRQARAAHQQILRSLEVLLGRYPAADIEAASEQLPLPPPIPPGVPVQILERRPDLLAGEQRIRAAFLLAEEARLARLPSFTLTATAGGNADVNDFVASIGAGIFAPLFTGGALEAQVDVANADQRAAIAVYGQAVLVAFREVEDALANEGLFEERERFLESVVSSNEDALEIARLQLEEGAIDTLSVLQIQARVVAARASLIGIRGQRLAQRVNLHLALGGSFNTDPGI
jgi:NodT family efflux transporter outer membrane factor (OMF) lipoprotein